MPVRAGTPHFREECLGLESAGRGDAGDVLGEHVECPLAPPLAVELGGCYRLDRGAAFEQLEAVARHEQRLARPVETMVGAADALDKTGGALGRSHLDHEIDRTPIDAQVERGGGDHGLERAPRHRRLDLAALLGG